MRDFGNVSIFNFTSHFPALLVRNEVADVKEGIFLTVSKLVISEKHMLKSVQYIMEAKTSVLPVVLVCNRDKKHDTKYEHG